jgi:hypothetical protein
MSSWLKYSIVDRAEFVNGTLSSQMTGRFGLDGVTWYNRFNPAAVEVSHSRDKNQPGMHSEHSCPISIYGIGGQQVAISADAQGRLIIILVEQVRALLMETFGVWAGRSDLSGDSIDYVDEIRRG